MNFAGTSTLLSRAAFALWAVLVATVAAAIVSAAWYSFIMAGTVNALRAGDPTIRGRQPGPPVVRSVCQTEADRRNKAERDPRWSYVCLPS